MLGLMQFWPVSTSLDGVITRNYRSRPPAGESLLQSRRTKTRASHRWCRWPASLMRFSRRDRCAGLRHASWWRPLRGSARSFVDRRHPAYSAGSRCGSTPLLSISVPCNPGSSGHSYSIWPHYYSGAFLLGRLAINVSVRKARLATPAFASMRRPHPMAARCTAFRLEDCFRLKGRPWYSVFGRLLSITQMPIAGPMLEGRLVP